MSKQCKDVQKELSMGPELEARMLAHCKTCEACGVALEEARTLAAAFLSLRTASARDASRLDVSSQVLANVQAQET